ncbi:MAG: GNAT family N-acetyltransferase [Nostoc sp. NMS1]|uniref:GNAT family N-acetyltransferase n=1 Tax=unclassified Nostoc TaxID=2593658 RepID=UPI0025CF8AD5|nr:MULTISPECIES: GNAT family N-acetyltransferase [unclassified Nostoc]MBN3910918.1 GNAT family N-acetyltransferase [Nostoc sp. NMS1]MBN3993059.1 GNAT family N-acetyltransferase [Nostoc sp. NMS2]
MTVQFDYSTLAHPQDIQQLEHIFEQCFISALGGEEAYINMIGVKNFRIIRRLEQIVGGLATLDMGQWWGGQRVPMTGIAVVGIAPEYRGSGAAIALMQHTLKELYDRGIAISALYPAVQSLYRKVGYEQGGSWCIWEIATQNIQVREQPLPLELVASINHEVFHKLYQQQARQTHGYLDRHPAIWERIIQPNEKEIVYTYLIGTKDQPQGYIIFTQERTENGEILFVKDWVLSTVAAAQTFWSFLASHRSQIQQVRWKSSAIDSLTLLLPEQTAKIKTTSRWLLRIIDVVKALELRGYPPTIQTELHLEIQDNLLTGNNDKFILSVANGRGEVTRGGKGELQLDIRELAPLYTSLFTPYHLQIAGKLNGTETAILAATQIFAGASPWMADFF